MALLGSDSFEAARGLIGRAVEAVRDLGSSLMRRMNVAAQRVARVMPLVDAQYPSKLPSSLKWLAPALRFLRRILVAIRPGGPVATKIASRVNSWRIVRFISRKLLRKILVSNLIGFTILFIGILYLSLDSGWVINAKSDALKIQGQIIAAAIAGDAKVSSTDFTLDPETIPGKEPVRVPLRDDGFAALELSIQPQFVTPILNRLIEPIKTRARIYDQSGTLVVDSSMWLKNGQFTETNAKVKKNPERPRTKNFWTRLQHWLIDKEVQVYKEIGTANGKYYPEVRGALKGNTEAMLLLNRKGEQIVSMAVPIQRMGRVLGVLLLSTPPGEVDDILAEERKGIWPLAFLALVASIVTSLLIAQAVAGPMKRLSETAELVSQDINAHVNLPSYEGREDEVGRMAKAFRSMTKSLFARIEASEKFAADVAHELKNPLTAASSTAQALEFAKTPEQRALLVEQIQGELKRLNRLITDVSSASRLNAELARQSSDPVAVDAVLQKIVMIFEDKAAKRDCRLILDVSSASENQSYVVLGNEGRIAQVFTNLIDNALSFSPDKSEVRISASRVGDFVEVFVDDDGPGIEEDKLETIFSRFYTYRPTMDSSRGDNSGLGLSISNEIVQAHAGEIWALNRTSGDGPNAGNRLGARFVVRLPVRRSVANRSGNTIDRTGTSSRGGATGA